MKPRIRTLCVVLLGGGTCSGIIAWTLYVSRPIAPPPTILAAVAGRPPTEPMASAATVQYGYTEQDIESMTLEETRVALVNRHLYACHLLLDEQQKIARKREFELLLNKLKASRTQ